MEYESITVKPPGYNRCFHVSTIKSLSDYADNNIILPDDTNREGGPWETSRTPYNRGPMEVFLLPYVRQSTMCAATQLGKTSAHQLNPLIYTIAENPLPTAFIYPTGDVDKEMSETRIQPLIRACPATAALIPENPDLFKLKRMKFPGMTLYMLSAGTLGDAKQKQVCNFFFDEVETYVLSGGQEADEGSVFGRYLERGKGYNDIRKVIISSSRVRIGGLLDKCLASSEVVFKWHSVCPFCGEFISLSRDVFYYDDAGEGTLDRIKKAGESAYFACKECGGMITDEHKAYISEEGNGDWLPGIIMADLPNRNGEDTEPEHYIWQPMPDLNVCDYQKKGSYIWYEYCEKHRPEYVGWTDLYTSYSPWVSFSDIAKKAVLVGGDFEEEKVFYKDWWCEVAQPKVKAFRASELLELIEERKRGIVPTEAVALVAGVDNQGNRLYGSVWAVNRMEPGKEKMWLVWYGEIQKPGHDDPTETDYSALSDWLKKKYTREGTNVPTIPIWRAGVDTGGTKIKGAEKSMTKEVYDFLADNCFLLPGMVWGTKGSTYEHTNKPLVAPGSVKINNIFPIQFIDTFNMKWMRAKLIDKKRIKFFKDTVENYREFFKHITAEVCVDKGQDKGAEWVMKPGYKRRDYGDTLVIALAMLWEINGQSIKNITLSRDREKMNSAAKKEAQGGFASSMMNQRKTANETMGRLRGRVGR